MPYKMEFNGIYEVYTETGNLLTKTNDYTYAVEVLGNNQGSKLIDTITK